MKENLKKVLKKVFIAFIVVLIAFGTVFVLIGMGGLTQYAPVKISDTSDTAFASDNSRFLITQRQITDNGVYALLVDKETKVQYLCFNGGIAVYVDAAGNPLLYDGVLE